MYFVQYGLRIISCLTILSFLGIVDSTKAQDPHYFNFNTEHGLPSPETYNVYVDEKNLIWILTDRGICTYDGREFQTYTTEDGLATNTNFDLYKDQEGNIWFTGFGEALSYFDGKKFHPFQFNPTLKKTCKGSWPESLAFVDGNLIFSLHSYSLTKDKNQNFINRLDLTTGEAMQIEDENCTLLSYEDYQYELHQFDGNYFLSNDNVQALHNPLLLSDSVLIAFHDSTLLRLDLKNLKLTGLKLNRTINDCSVTGDGRIWACTYQGLFCFRDHTLQDEPEVFFRDMVSTGVTMDHEGNYWISTLNKGLIMVPSFDIKTICEKEHSLTKEKALSIGVLGEHLLIGTGGHDIYSVDEQYQLSSLLVTDSHEDIGTINVKNNRALVGPNYSILERGDSIELSTFHSDTTMAKMYLELDNGHVVSLSRTTFWFQDSIGRTLFRIPEESWFPYRLTCVEESFDGGFWIGTLGGLYSFEWPDANIVDLSVQYSLFQTRINDLKKDSKGNLWAATLGHGVVCLSKDTIFNISAPQVLSSNMVNRIYLEGDSAIWVGTNSGLGYIEYEWGESFKIKEVASYSTDDGLLSSYINDMAIWNGYTWVATDKGVNYFRKEDLKHELPLTPTMIKGVFVGEKNYSDSPKFKFTHTQNDIGFEFASIVFRKKGHDPVYRYTLKDKSERQGEWKLTNHQTVSITDIPHGKYLFKVQARNGNGEWGQAAEYQFEVLPHFSQTLWFILGVGFFLVGSVVLLINWYLHIQRKKQEQLQALQKAQWQTAKAELATLRSQMNPHFVFNVLNAIQNFIFKKDVQQASHFLTKFGKLVRQSLTYSRLGFISLEKEVQFIRSYLEIETMRFPGKFNFSVHVSGDEDEATILVPPLLVQPLVENSINHGLRSVGRTGQIDVSYLVFIEKNRIEISVRDNGIGFATLGDKKQPTKTGKRSYGLNIVGERISLLNSITKGTTVASMSISNIKSTNEVAIGTEVKLVVPIKFGN